MTKNIENYLKYSINFCDQKGCPVDLQWVCCGCPEKAEWDDKKAEIEKHDTLIIARKPIFAEAVQFDGSDYSIEAINNLLSGTKHKFKLKERITLDSIVHIIVHYDRTDRLVPQGSWFILDENDKLRIMSDKEFSEDYNIVSVDFGEKTA